MSGVLLFLERRPCPPLLPPLPRVVGNTAHIKCKSQTDTEAMQLTIFSCIANFLNCLANKVILLRKKLNHCKHFIFLNNMLCHYFTLAVILLYRCDAESHINAKIKYICVKTINNGNGLNDSLKGITKSLELEK